MMTTKPKGDILLIISIALVCVIGLPILFSASHQHALWSGSSFVLKQCLWLLLCFVMMFFVLRIPAARWFDLAGLIYVVNILLLILVLIVGSTRFGAQRWLPIGSQFAFQPSELIKISLVLALARYLGSRSPQQYVPKTIIFSFMLVMVPMFLIMIQPDLGTAIVLLPVYMAMLWVWGAPLKWVGGLFASLLSLGPLLWYVLKDYQKQRLLVFMDPNQDPLGAGYSIIQSKIAIGSGGLWGKSWLAGTQNQLNFLPERHTDFIFSVVGEEWGFMGASILIFIYWVLIWRCFKLADNQTDMMARLLTIGITTLLVMHLFINIGMTTGLMPVVGLPLPLISYGGSSLVGTLFSLSLLVSLSFQNR
jgi:rod shape determining protein RodA